MNELNNKIDEILGHDSDSFGFVCDSLLTEVYDTPQKCNCKLPERRAKILALITEQVRLGRIDELERITGFSDARGVMTMGEMWGDPPIKVTERIAQLKDTTKEDV